MMRHPTAYLSLSSSARLSLVLKKCRYNLDFRLGEYFSPRRTLRPNETAPLSTSREFIPPARKFTGTRLFQQAAYFFHPIWPLSAQIRYFTSIYPIFIRRIYNKIYRKNRGDSGFMYDRATENVYASSLAAVVMYKRLVSRFPLR
ncbi:hypothetical protein PUN28_017264 [Cardiocondyla obscurior]|uniref:Uncharacterized protein n=1 Tax=Cardiocondyla obscurior TaxID=286306 RepID=A0AAW2EKZ8_9HYME